MIAALILTAFVLTIAAVIANGSMTLEHMLAGYELRQKGHLKRAVQRTSRAHTYRRRRNLLAALAAVCVLAAVTVLAADLIGPAL